jgi:DNA damage-binding protein 1
MMIVHPVLQVVGEYHLGEFVNRFRAGSLVMKMPDSEAAAIPTMLFATINGVIGLVASLPKAQFEFLNRLQVWQCAADCVQELQAGAFCRVLVPAAVVGLSVFSPDMQTALRRVIKGIGGFDHAEWRAFRSERTKADARGFIDGDLIEQVHGHMS